MFRFVHEHMPDWKGWQYMLIGTPLIIIGIFVPIPFDLFFTPPGGWCLGWGLATWLGEKVEG